MSESPTSGVPLYDELRTLLKAAGIEIRVESFKNPPDSAGGLCVMKGRHLVLLDSHASKPEQARALLEVLERVGLARLGLSGTDLSPELLTRLNRRGQMPWPHRSQAPSVAKFADPHSFPLRLVHYSPPLSELTTMGVGGAASHFVEAKTDQDVIDAARECREARRKLFPLGGGSNVIVADAGIKGTVLHMRTRGISITSQGAFVHVTAQAGEPWHEFAAQMTSSGYAGLECLGGIPGAVGATPIQNVGAYGQEVSQSIVRVTALDRHRLEVRTFDAAECRFSYRNSIFKHRERDNYIVLSVTFALKPGGEPSIRYGELSREFTDASTAKPSLTEVFDTVLKLRRAKSMVLDRDDPNGRSCGSFFVNAQIPQKTAHKISAIVGEEMPSFPGENGLIKVPSAWLIERAGFEKGTTRGAVGLSTKHTLAIVAHQNATAHEVVEFAHHVRAVVAEKFSVTLTPEPHFWGFGRLDDGLPPRKRTR